MHSGPILRYGHHWKIIMFLLAGLLIAINLLIFNVQNNGVDMREPKLAAVIAKELRRFHEVEIPGSKESQLWIDLSKFFEKGLVLD